MKLHLTLMFWWSWTSSAMFDSSSWLQKLMSSIFNVLWRLSIKFLTAAKLTFLFPRISSCSRLTSLARAASSLSPVCLCAVRNNFFRFEHDSVNCRMAPELAWTLRHQPRSRSSSRWHPCARSVTPRPVSVEHLHRSRVLRRGWRAERIWQTSSPLILLQAASERCSRPGLL